MIGNYRYRYVSAGVKNNLRIEPEKVNTRSFSSTKIRFTDTGDLFQSGDLAHCWAYQWIFRVRNVRGLG